MHHLIGIAICLLSAMTVRAEVQLRPVEYKHDGLTLEGCLVADASSSAKRPGVLLACESGGSASQATRARALQLARLGYTVFAADLFGKGVVPKDSREAALKSGFASDDRKLLRARIQSACQVMLQQASVDAKKIAAVGYGVGGSAVLELARSGIEELEAVIVVHGDVSTTTPADAKKIGAEIFVFVGSDDPVVTPAQLAAFEAEMRSGGVDWNVTRYGGVLGDFTNPQARDNKGGRAYEPYSDVRTQESIRTILAEALAPAKAAPVVKPVPRPDAKLPVGVPAKVANILRYVDENRVAMAGYEGGRTFLNIEQLLPKRDAQGRAVKYREWDVNPLRAGVNRGAERLITGSNGSAYYTDDHYKSFKRIR